MSFLLWLLAIVLIVVGIVRLVQRDFLWGIVLIVLGIVLGSGGAGLFV